MDIAELRSKLDNIAAELAEQDVQQEDIAIEEEQVEEVEQPVAEEDSVEEAIEDGKTYAWINVVTGDHGYGTKEESSNWTHYIPMSDFSYFSGDEDYKGLDDETAQEQGWIPVKEVHEAQVTENKMSEKVTEIVDMIMKLAERETEQWADDPEMDGGDANYFMSVARELEGSDWDMARDAILDGDTAPKEEVLSIIADNSPELLKALFPQDAEKEQYLATMRRESISEQLKDELINELMGD